MSNMHRPPTQYGPGQGGYQPVPPTGGYPMMHGGGYPSYYLGPPPIITPRTSVPLVIQIVVVTITVLSVIPLFGAGMYAGFTYQSPWRHMDSSQAQSNSGEYTLDLYDNTLHVTCNNFRLGPLDADGAQTLLVDVTVVNNTDEDRKFHEYIPGLSQKGTPLGSAYVTTNMGAPADFHDTVGIDSVSPGQSVTGTLAFKYIYVGDPVRFGWDGDELSTWTWQPS